MAAPVSLQQLLDAGLALEREHRWSDALTHYEESLRAHPQWRELQQRESVARAHLDISRRYGDTSFVQSLDQLTRAAGTGPVCGSAVEDRYVPCPRSELGSVGLSGRAEPAGGSHGTGVCASVPAAGHAGPQRSVLARRSTSGQLSADPFSSWRRAMPRRRSHESPRRI